MKAPQKTPKDGTRARGYQAAILELLPELKEGVFVAEIKHDPWCALLNGTGPCNCYPDVIVRRLDSGKDYNP